MTEAKPARVVELERMREQLGTAPSAMPPRETRFYRGVEGIRVDVVDGPRNPYKAMYCMAVSTWGTGVWSSSLAGVVDRTAIDERWEQASPEARFYVVNAVLAFQALPLALEAPKFTFAIENLSRWSFDQIVRARIGFVASSLGTRDNCHLDMAFRMHETTWRDPEKRQSFVANAIATKERYGEIVDRGKGSWQEARTWLPISVVHRFVASVNYMALRGLCAKRMSFSEAEDTVAVAWLLKDRLERGDGFPLLARWLRPRCDFAGACGYHKAHTLSEAFGCLFKSCGRNPVRSAPGNPELDYDYADFNESCSDAETISRQLGIRIAPAGVDVPSADDGPETLTVRDRFLFGFRAETPEQSELYHAWRAGTLEPAGPSGRYVEPTDVETTLTETSTLR
jgi:hypothetical protein